MDKCIKIKLDELEKTADQFWNITPDIGNILNMLIKIAEAKECLEVGMSNGYSAIWFLEALKSIGGHLTSIEFYENRVEMAKSNFEFCGLSDYITVLQGRALDILPTLTQTFDYIFIDANKSQYKEYFEILHPKLKQGGILVADNVFSHSEKVKDFIELISSSNYQIEYLHMGGGVLIGYKN